MVRRLRERAAAAGLRNVIAERMGAEDLTAPERAFDAAVCALGLMYVPDRAAAVGELVRVTRPGGKVVATVWGERRSCGWAEVFPIVDARVASEVSPMFFASGGKGVLAREFEEAGLFSLEETRQRELLHFDAEDELVTAVMFGGPVALAVKRFSSDDWSAVRGEFLVSVAPYRRDDGSYAIPGEFVTISGRRPT